jgi:putative holliday junction resolvase
MGRIIAIDIGQKRIGLAVTDPMQMIATPLDTVPVHNIWEYLQNYFKINEVEAMVAGYPTRLDGTDSEAARFVKPFIARFRKLFPGMGVFIWDERFTSVMAQAAILESGVRKKKRQDKALVDKVSATILLQSFMERKIIEKE